MNSIAFGIGERLYKPSWCNPIEKGINISVIKNATPDIIASLLFVLLFILKSLYPPIKYDIDNKLVVKIKKEYFSGKSMK